MNHMKIIYSLLFILLYSPIHAGDDFTTEDIYSLKDITHSDVSEDGNRIVLL